MVLSAMGLLLRAQELSGSMTHGTGSKPIVMSLYSHAMLGPHGHYNLITARAISHVMASLRSVTLGSLARWLHGKALVSTFEYPDQQLPQQ